MAIKLPKLPANQRLINSDGTPTLVFSLWWQQVVKQVETAVNAILAIPEIQAALGDLNTAIDTAQAAADNANNAADTIKAENALVNSSITPASVLSATPTTITIANHTRDYADGTSVSVTGGTMPATAPGDIDYVSYSDPSRAGGAVTYIVSTTAPVQSGNIHVVGAVTIPSAGTMSGGVGPRPGYVTPFQ